MIPFRVAVAGCEVTSGGGAWLTGAAGLKVIVDGGGSCTGLNAWVVCGLYCCWFCCPYTEHIDSGLQLKCSVTEENMSLCYKDHKEPQFEAILSKTN